MASPKMCTKTFPTHECPHCGEDLRPQKSTDGSNSELQSRIRFLEEQLMKAALAQPKCTEKAFSDHVSGRVAEALAEQRAHYEATVREAQEQIAFLRREVAAFRKMVVDENVMMQAVMQKYQISLDEAKRAVKEMEMPDETENSPAYVSFLKMSQKGRVCKNEIERVGGGNQEEYFQYVDDLEM